MRQIGNVGLNRYGSHIYEEFLPELRWPQAGRIYKEMASNDPVIGATLYLAEMLIRGIKWSVEPSDDCPEAIEAENFLKSCLDDMEISWADTINEILSMLTYGFSVHEIVYKVRRGPNQRNKQFRSRYSDGKIGWRKLPIRSQQTIDKWEFNDANELIGVWQQAPPKWDRVYIPVDKMLLFTTTSSRENPEGRSLLRSSYRCWHFKKVFEEIEGIGIERDLAGFPVLTAPDQLDLWNEEDPNMVKLRKQAEELVASVRRDSNEGILLPYGWTLALLSSPSNRTIDISATINRYDNRIAMTMLSDVLLLGEKSGSFALSETKQSMLAAALQAQVNNIASRFNAHAIPQLMSVNGFSMEHIPTLVPGTISTPTISEVALILKAAGLDFSADLGFVNYVRNLLGMESVDEEHNLATSRERVEDETNPDDVFNNQFEQSDMAYT